MSEDKIYDLIVIGGGAAGYFGAISAAEGAPWSRVLILEKTGEALTKVKISGGGRCNVTHACFEPSELVRYYPRGGKSLIGPFHRWDAADTVEWFADRGVKLKTESDGRMFPVTDDSRTIISCLDRAAEIAGVEARLKAEVVGLGYDGEIWKIGLKGGEQFQSRAVLLATGGIRNNAGVKLAGNLGHAIVAAAPSLFTFKINDCRLEDLSGISVPHATASIPAIKIKTEGACLITHWGLSGPTILKLSAQGARELAELDYQFEVIINWCAMNEPQLLDVLAKSRDESPKKRVRSGVSDLPIPGRLWQRLVDHAEIGEETIWANLSKAGRHALVRNLLACRFKVDGKSMNKEEFVTAGGVDLKEVDFKTMESRIHPGLFFAGEVIDVDGVTGGFNFQAAWTTARIAGESAVGVS
jgi:hypothetical protein